MGTRHTRRGAPVLCRAPLVPGEGPEAGVRRGAPRGGTAGLAGAGAKVLTSCQSLGVGGGVWEGVGARQGWRQSETDVTTRRRPGQCGAAAAAAHE
ncbi:hypothetical protein E2C01_069131 [Portunus trituberculatus]|uniref:Uncharacterized protein n=1 Tax=Portunus trituberculatus TaxID=210409 RepID=A0A5B7HYF3_PORTR|nr:hypothetical protein [Portunus trituberculatus]